jgi:hypothetical protein
VPEIRTGEVSVIPSRDFFTAVERLFQEGLPTKVFVAKPYRELYRGFVEREQFEAQPRSLPNPPAAGRPFRPRVTRLISDMWKGPSFHFLNAPPVYHDAIVKDVEGCFMALYLRQRVGV